MTTQNIFDLVDTWASGGGPYTSIKMNATDNDSASASLLMDLQVGTVSQFKVSKAGVTNVRGDILPFVDNGINIGSGAFRINTITAATAVRLTSAGAFDWSDTFLTRRAAANLRLGAADAAAPVAQTLSVQSVVAGTTNTAGTNLTITGSQGTGLGAGGSIIFQVAPAGSTGTAQNALATALTIDSTKSLLLANNSTSSPGIQFGSNGGFYASIYGSQYAIELGMAGVVGGTFSSAFGTLKYAINIKELTFGAGSSAIGVIGLDAANTLALRNGTAAQTFRVYNTYDGTNDERGSLRWSSNTFQIITEATGTGTVRPIFIGGLTGNKGITLNSVTNTIAFAPGGGDGPLMTVNSIGFSGWLGGGAYSLFGNTQAGNTNRAGSNLNIYSFGGSGNAAVGQVGLYASLGAASGTAAHTFELAIRTFLPATGTPGIQFGGETSSFPAIKRSSTTLQARLADDSAFASVQGKLTTETAYTAGAPTATGYLVVYDSAGTAYRIPAVLN